MNNSVFKRDLILFWRLNYLELRSRMFHHRHLSQRLYILVYLIFYFLAQSEAWLWWNYFCVLLLLLNVFICCRLLVYKWIIRSKCILKDLTFGLLFTTDWPLVDLVPVDADAARFVLMFVNFITGWSGFKDDQTTAVLSSLEVNNDKPSFVQLASVTDWLCPVTWPNDRLQNLWRKRLVIYTNKYLFLYH